MEGLSELEKRRLENIERNAQYLEGLGINAHKSSRSGAKSSSSKTAAPKTKKEVPYIPEESLRRSSRIASLPQPTTYAEDQQFPADILGNERRASNRKRKGESNIGDSDSDADTVPMKMQKIHSFELAVGTGLESLPTFHVSPPVKAEGDSRKGFASSMMADVRFWCHPKQLAQPCEVFGKAAIMSLSVLEDVGKSQRSPTAHAVRFNKFSGVAEWTNSLFLWVNIAGCGVYDNTFSNEGRHMMWYGGSKMDAESRIVQRLIHPSNQYHDAQGGPMVKSEHAAEDSHTILLFVRLEGEGYACLGRCQYVAVDLATHPIAIKWNLLDYEHLRHTKYFQQILHL